LEAEDATAERLPILERANSVSASFAPSWPLIRPLVYAIGGTVALVASAFAIISGERVMASEFGLFYSTGQAAWSGASWYVPHGDLNPPAAGVLFAPLAWFAPSTAFLVWTFVNIVVSAWAVWRIARTLEVPWPLIAIATALLTGSLVTLRMGQLSGLLFAVVTAAWLADRRGSARTAGLLLGIAIAFKPFLGMFVVGWLVMRRWTAAIAALIAITAVSMIGLVFGAERYVEWARLLRSIDWYSEPMNASFRGLVASQGWPVWVSGICSGAVALATVVAVRRAPIDAAWLALLASSILLSPLGWVYYTPLLVGPAVAVGVQSARARPLLIIGTLCLISPYPPILPWIFGCGTLLIFAAALLRPSAVAEDFKSVELRI
jgi:Glycosyltransferase family 87